MLDYFAGAATRGAVIIPVALVAASLTCAARAFDLLRPDQSLDGSDIRTWPLSAALRDGAVDAGLAAAIG